MENNSNFFSAERRAKIISIIVLSLLLITVWNMLDLVLMTFVLCFIFYVLLDKIKIFFADMGIRIPAATTLVVLYIVFITAIIGAIGLFIPTFIARVTEIVNIIIQFDWAAFNEALSPRLSRALTVIDMSSYIADATMYLTRFMTDLSTIIAHFALTLALAVLLSFLILIERKKIALFGEHLAQSQIADFYTYFIKFGKNFCKTFGKVMRVQVTIATVNCVLSVLVFKLIGLPDIIALGIMVFFLGLIPVAGVIISLIPLSAIAFNTGGIIMVIEILLTIAVLHAIEAYFLNPKLMANKTQLPVCFVFSILLVGEHYMGVWGLLIGVPIFIFMMDALGVKYEEGMRKHSQYKGKFQQRKKKLRKKAIGPEKQ